MGWGFRKLVEIRHGVSPGSSFLLRPRDGSPESTPSLPRPTHKTLSKDLLLRTSIRSSLLERILRTLPTRSSPESPIHLFDTESITFPKWILLSCTTSVDSKPYVRRPLQLPSVHLLEGPSVQTLHDLIPSRNYLSVRNPISRDGPLPSDLFTGDRRKIVERKTG